MSGRFFRFVRVHDFGRALHHQVLKQNSGKEELVIEGEKEKVHLHVLLVDPLNLHLPFSVLVFYCM